jgi:hypothetical protein
MKYAVLTLLVFLSIPAFAEFSMEDDGKALTVMENGKQVLVYHYELVTPPEGVDEHFRRMGYIHPLYGMDGEVMTQDFPGDHYHHRGVFWGWPNTTIGERAADVWALAGIRQIHEKWLVKEAGADRAEIAAQNVWVFDDAPDTPAARETVRIIVHPSKKNNRSIDVSYTLENLSVEEMVVRGSTTEDTKAKRIKGYGGFNLRPDAERKPMSFMAASGVVEKDVLWLDSPWADISYAKEKGIEELSGVAIFEHADNPGYPHPGWILRKYGFLGQSWPHLEPKPLATGESFELKHRLFIHRGNAKKGRVAKAFAKYSK